MVSPVARSDVIEDLQRVADELGETPSTTQYEEHGEYSKSTIYRKFDGMQDARRQAGLDSGDQRGGQNEISKDELLESIRGLYDQLGHVPRREEMIEHGDYSEGPFRREFGSWGKAVVAAGFEPYRPNSDLAERTRVCCAWCGDDSLELKSQVQDQQNWFCSRSCKHDWQEEHVVGENHHQYERVSVPCDWCGDEIKRKPSVAEVKDRAFCDLECFSEWCSEERVEEQHPRYKGGDQPSECEYCGEEYTVRPAKLEASRFCSYDCLGEWQRDSEAYAGEDNPNWEGGYEPYYGPNWTKQREKALRRDSNTCQDCGLTAEESKSKYGQELSVHHRRPFRLHIPEEGEPNYEKANRLDNLVTLCVACHTKWESLPIQPDIR